MKSRNRRAERMSEFVTSMFQYNVTVGITRSEVFLFLWDGCCEKKLWNAGISMFRQVDVMKVVQEGTQTSPKLKVVVSTKRALAEAFLNLQPVIVKADEDFEQTRQPFQSKACQRVGEMLSGWLSAVMCRNLSWCCKALNYVEMNTRGVGECARVGDRFLAPIQRCLNKWLLENVVEGLRSGIQTSFYTCDYTTKPALTCGPMLRHLTVGMQRLEEQMQMELETAECQRLLEVYPVADQKPVPTVSPEAREARKRLCRLWTSANHAVMHGHCLMAIHLLTGREVIRSHVFWRLMMKRVIWGIFQQVSSHRGGTEDDGEQELGLNDVALGLVSAETDDPTGLAQAATTPGEVRADLSYENDGSVELRATSFYEDYLHRGDVEPLKSMNFYVYGMYVSCVHVQQLGDRITHVAEFDFVSTLQQGTFLRAGSTQNFSDSILAWHHSTNQGERPGDVGCSSPWLASTTSLLGFCQVWPSRWRSCTCTQDATVEEVSCRDWWNGSSKSRRSNRSTDRMACYRGRDADACQTSYCIWAASSIF